MALLLGSVVPFVVVVVVLVLGSRVEWSSLGKNLSTGVVCNISDVNHMALALAPCICANGKGFEIGAEDLP